jgi:hypothetical protein
MHIRKNDRGCPFYPYISLKVPPSLYSPNALSILYALNALNVRIHTSLSELGVIALVCPMEHLSWYELSVPYVYYAIVTESLYHINCYCPISQCVMADYSKSTVNWIHVFRNWEYEWIMNSLR